MSLVIDIICEMRSSEFTVDRYALVTSGHLNITV